MHLLTQSKNNVSALELKRHLGVSYKTAWLLKHKVMEVMQTRASSPAAWRSTTHISAASAPAASPGAARRTRCPSSPRCRPPRTDKRCGCALRPGPFTKEAFEKFGAKSLVRPLTVVSDGLGCFTAAEGAGVHERLVTGGGAASAKLPQFRAVNTMLSNLKTALSRTCHAFGFVKYAHRYIAEAQYRFNRRFDLRSILRRLRRAAAQTRPCPAAAIRASEACT